MKKWGKVGGSGIYTYMSFDKIFYACEVGALMQNFILLYGVFVGKNTARCRAEKNKIRLQM